MSVGKGLAGYKLPVTTKKSAQEADASKQHHSTKVMRKHLCFSLKWQYTSYRTPSTYNLRSQATRL
jgi:hypothetical protein